MDMVKLWYLYEPLKSMSRIEIRYIYERLYAPTNRIELRKYVGKSNLHV